MNTPHENRTCPGFLTKKTGIAFELHAPKGTEFTKKMKELIEKYGITVSEILP
jgi:hypothetical protein